MRLPPGRMLLLCVYSPPPNEVEVRGCFYLDWSSQDQVLMRLPPGRILLLCAYSPPPWKCEVISSSPSVMK